jgi:hypothetical protein
MIGFRGRDIPFPHLRTSGRWALCVSRAGNGRTRPPTRCSGWLSRLSRSRHSAKTTGLRLLRVQVLVWELPRCRRGLEDVLGCRDGICRDLHDDRRTVRPERLAELLQLIVLEPRVAQLRRERANAAAGQDPDRTAASSCPTRRWATQRSPSGRRRRLFAGRTCERSCPRPPSVRARSTVHERPDLARLHAATGTF